MTQWEKKGVLSPLLLANLSINKAPKITGFRAHSQKKKKNVMTLFLSNKGKIIGSPCVSQDKKVM